MLFSWRKVRPSPGSGVSAYPMSVPAKNIESMNVLMTVVGGNIVYQREDFRPSVTMLTMRGDSPTGLNWITAAARR